MNFVAYWFSDKIAIASAGAKPVSEAEAPRLYQMVRELTTRADLPMPRLYVIPSEQPNAFATGRNPKHAAVAVTAGITKLLSEDELRGVISHELAHVRNRDILTQSVASAIGAMITWIAYLLLWFGGDDDSPLGLIANLALFLLAPISATPDPARDLAPARVLGGRDRGRRSAATRSRSPRRCCGSRRAPRRCRCRSTRRPSRSTSSSRSRAAGIASLFSTHPPIEERVRRLRQMRPSLS